MKEMISTSDISAIAVVLIMNSIALIKLCKNEPIWISLKVLADMISLVYACTH